MKKLLIALIFFTLSGSSFAGWGNIFSRNNMTACGIGAAGGYGYAAMAGVESASSQLQAVGVGCLLTGIAYAIIDPLLEKNYAQKERDKNAALVNVINQYRRQDASLAPLSSDGKYYLDEQVIPSKKNPDGSISLEHLRLRIMKADQNIILGD